MRILIIDDNPRRYRRLVDRFTNVGLNRGDVTIVSCAMDARSALTEIKFDLMLIDLLIPLRIEDDPASKNSEELLREIVEYGELIKPRQIVGLTAFAKETYESAEYIKSVSWTVITYVENQDDWIDQVIRCIDYLDGESKMVAERQLQTDVAIICALPDPETRAVQRIPWDWQTSEPLDDVTFFQRGKYSSKGQTRSAVLTSLERMGMVSAALTTSKIISQFSPRLVAMAGICAGVPGKVNIGDLILADPCWDWQSGKRTADHDGSSFAISPHQIALEPALRSRFELMRSDRGWLDKICDEWPGDAPSRPRLVIGPLATGSAVLADNESINNIRLQHRDLLGVEMESYGIYTAARMSSKPRPIFLSLKAVCDFGDGSKNDLHQKFCAYVSAKSLQYFCENFLDGL